MERKRVNSSKLRSVGYDSNNQLLEIEFSSGLISQYFKVPSESYRKFINAPSLESFFRDNIDEEYSSKRIR